MANRKDKIKNITIIFLLVMLILTFFSNTIMNYSLVEVSTQQVTSGSITSKVRGSGAVEASENYSVTIDQTRKIATVNVKKEAEVATGDLLFTLEDTDSDELDAAKKSLNEAQAAYESAVLTAGITVAERQSIEAGKGSSLTQKQNEIAAANQRVKDAQAAVDAAQASVDKIKAQIDAVSNSTADTTAEEKAVLDADKKNSEAQDNLTNAEASYTPVKSAYDTALSSLQSAQSAYDEAVALKNEAQINCDKAEKAYKDDKTPDNDKKTAWDNAKTALDASVSAMNKAKRQLDTAQSTFNTCQANLNKVQGSYDSAKSAATDSKNALSNANYNLSVKKLTGTNTAEANNLQAQLNTATAALTDANTALTNATNDQKKVTDKISGEVTIASAYKTMTDLQEEVAKLQAKSIGTEITAPISGTVTDIAVTAGTTVNANDVMMTIQPENKAYVLQFSVTENQAKKVRVGDTAEILNNWYGNDVSAVVSSIRKDPQNRSNSIIICEMKGDVSVGDNYTLSIGEQSSNYDTIVPTSAIREDSNGKFILIIESKSTPLGNRYYARRVDVDVITSDDTKSAVTGALEGYEYVITTTTKPIKENEQVRLASE
jgi:multidrug efflux pump subunit AcrA (membrane-fusion protein)